MDAEVIVVNRVSHYNREVVGCNEFRMNLDHLTKYHKDKNDDDV